LEFDAFMYMPSQQESRSKSESEIINVSNCLHMQIHHKLRSSEGMKGLSLPFFDGKKASVSAYADNLIH
jgi:hypothetical protein